MKIFKNFLKIFGVIFLILMGIISNIGCGVTEIVATYLVVGGLKHSLMNSKIEEKPLKVAQDEHFPEELEKNFKIDDDLKNDILNNKKIFDVTENEENQ